MHMLKNKLAFGVVVGISLLVGSVGFSVEEKPKTVKEFLGFSDILTSYGEIYGYNGDFSFKSYNDKLGALPKKDLTKVFQHYAANYAFEVAFSTKDQDLKKQFRNVADIPISKMSFQERQFVDAVTTAINNAVDGGEIMIYPEDTTEILRFVPLVIPLSVNDKNQKDAFARLNQLTEYASKKSKLVSTVLSGQKFERKKEYHQHHHGDGTGPNVVPAVKHKKFRSSAVQMPSPIKRFYKPFSAEKERLSFGECTIRERIFGTPNCHKVFGTQYSQADPLDPFGGAGPDVGGGDSCAPGADDPQSCSDGPMPASTCGNGLTHPPMGGTGRLDDGIGASRGGGSRRHAGIDMSTQGTSRNEDCGQPIYAARSGFVSRCTTIDGNLAGNIVVLDHCDGKYTRYFHLRPGSYLGQPAGDQVEDTGNHGGGHCAPFGLTIGRYIPGGQQIAEMGRSCSYVNRNMSCHLHFELRGGAYGGSQVYNPNEGGCLQQLEDGNVPVTTCSPPPGIPVGTSDTTIPGDGPIGDGPADEQDQQPNNPPVVGEPGLGSGDEDKGLETIKFPGGSNTFEGDAFEKTEEGGNVESGSDVEDDRSVQTLTGANPYITEDDFDFSRTMAWIEDFEQFGMPPQWGDFSNYCWYWRRRSFFRIAIAPLPACNVKVNYTEPTAMVEVVGEPGLSYLGDLEDLVAETDHSDGGVGMGLGPHGLSFNEAHVFGISPQARTESSGSTRTVRRSFTCDMAVSGIETWENMTLPGLVPFTLTPNIDMEGGVPDLMFTLQTPGVTALISPLYQLKWYLGASDRGRDTRLPLLFASEERHEEWVNKPGDHGTVTAGSVPCDQNGRIDAGMTASAMPDRNQDCVGSWGPLEPATGFSYGGTDLSSKALIAARAYGAAKKESIAPLLAPAPTAGPLIPKVEYAHIGWKYWYTDFNIEWPYEGKQRFMLGEDAFKWDSTLMQNNYRSRDVQNWRDLDKTSLPPGAEITKDGLIMTLWKNTTCRIYVCCHRWSYETRWRHISTLPFVGSLFGEDAWEIKDVDEIDDWTTEHARDFNPPRL